MSGNGIDEFRALMKMVGIKAGDPSLPAFEVVWVTAWMASRSAALKEAAQVCDQLRQDALGDMEIEKDERFGVYAKKYALAAYKVRSLDKR